MVDVIIPGAVERVRQLLSDEPTATTLGHFKDRRHQCPDHEGPGRGLLSLRAHGAWWVPTRPLVKYSSWLCRLIDAGLEETCLVLIDFLTVDLVAPSTAVPMPITVHQQVGVAGYVHGPTTISCHCKAVLYRDLPLLCPASLAPFASYPALLGVASGVQYIVIEALAKRNDRSDVRTEAQRHGGHGPSVSGWEMRSLIVSSFFVTWGGDEEMPALCHDWGTRARGVSEWWVVQHDIEADCVRQCAPPSR
jgi:hypothetical protein